MIEAYWHDSYHLTNMEPDMWILPLLIIIAPVAVLLLKTGSKQGWRWRIFGAVAGLTIVPISYGMNIAAYHIPVLSIGMPMEIIGMLLLLFHEAPGYQLGIWLGLYSGNEVISQGMPYYYSLQLSAIFWFLIYGGAGYLFDIKRSGHKSTLIPA